MSKELITHKQQVQQLESLIREKLTRRVAEVLPKAIGTSTDRFLANVFTVLASNPKLAQCDRASILTGILRAAQAGLELDGVQAALVPYKNIATFVPMYQGYIRAMYRSGIVNRVQIPRLIYRGDQLEYEYGLSEKLRHVPKLEMDNQTNQNIIAGYCIVTMLSGEMVWEIVPRRVFDAIKARSHTSSPWHTEDGYPGMCMKTCVRRDAKFVAQRAEQAELAQMIARDEALDRGEVETPINFDEKPDQVQLDSLDSLFNLSSPEDRGEAQEQEKDKDEF